MNALRMNGDLAAVGAAEEKLAEIQSAIEGVIQRAANIRAGYVYVISNIGAFGEGVVKIGMTRRLDPYGSCPRAWRRICPTPLRRARPVLQ